MLFSSWVTLLFLELHIIYLNKVAKSHFSPRARALLLQSLVSGRQTSFFRMSDSWKVCSIFAVNKEEWTPWLIMLHKPKASFCDLWYVKIYLSLIYLIKHLRTDIVTLHLNLKLRLIEKKNERKKAEEKTRLLPLVHPLRPSAPSDGDPGARR